MIRLIRNIPIKEIIIHSTIWIILLLLNYLFFGFPGLNLDFSFNFKTWALFLILFYVNYSLLIPYILFKKKYFLYFTLIIILFTSILYFKFNIDKQFFDKHRKGDEMSIKKQDSNNNFEKNKTPEINKKANNLPKELNKQSNQKDNRKKKFHFNRILMPIISQLLLILLASLSFRFIKKMQDDEQKRIEIEKERVSTELNFLKQQIHPHFLFNAINSIYSLSLSKKENASDAILKLSTLLRYMLYETEKTKVALTDELQAINDYIEIQKLRLTPLVKVSFEINGDAMNYQISPLLLLPLIENAFKHGVDNQNPSFIIIQINITNSQIKLSVMNSISLNTKTDEAESGIGIKNIIRRLDLLYPNEYRIEKSIENNTFIVHLTITLNEVHSH